MPRVYVSIGSNIDKEKNIRSAVRALASLGHSLTASAVYECAPVGFAGDDFYNLVVGFETDLPVDRLIATLHSIERAHGRVRAGPRFGPRTLDMDVLVYGDLVRHDAVVDVPRTDIRDYAFVLRPLAEIAPERRHPETGRRYAQMWQDFDDSQQALRVVAMELDLTPSRRTYGLGGRR